MSLDGTVVRGDDIELTIDVTDEDGAVVDLSGIQQATFKMKTTKNGAVEYSRTLGNGVTVLDAVNGVLVITLPNADSANFKTRIYFYEVEIKDFAGLIATVRNEDVTPGNLTIVADL